MNKSSEPLTTDQLFSRTKKRQLLIAKRLSLVGGIAVLLILLQWSNLLLGMEKKVLDSFLSVPQSLFKNVQTSVDLVSAPEPVLILISKKSLDQIGAWPWSNRYHARFFQILKRAGARGVYFDPLLSGSASEEDDALLEESIKRFQAPLFLSSDREIKHEVLGQGLKLLESSEVGQSVWSRPSIQFEPYAQLVHRVLRADSDGVFRFWHPSFSADRLTLSAAPLKVAESFSERAVFKNQPVSLKPVFIPWDTKTLFSIPRVELSDLVNSSIAQQNGMQEDATWQILKNRFCFVGLADENQIAMGRSPWNQVVAPVEAAAMIYSGLIRNSALAKESPVWISWSLLLLTMVALLLFAGFLSGWRFWLGVGALFIVNLILPCVSFFTFHFWLQMLSGIFFLGVSAVAILIFDSLTGSQERSNLFHLATRDGLTGLYVIRHFRVIMNQMTREARARKENIAVILMDIDHFKKINDTYGHPAGDMVLKKTADAIQAAVRQKRTMKDIDFVARYGGEEFIILIRRNSLENVSGRIAERIRKTIQAAEYDWNGTKISVTVSLGVAILGESENIPDAMVHRADKALYLSKQNGRNRVSTESDLRGIK